MDELVKERIFFYDNRFLICFNPIALKGQNCIQFWSFWVQWGKTRPSFGNVLSHREPKQSHNVVSFKKKWQKKLEKYPYN